MTGRFLTIFLAASVVCAICGCRSESTALRLADLTPAERQYIERFVTLERARAVALVDTATGLVLLDSLATAWGENSLAETRRNLSQKPLRVEAVNDLLQRILTAERDSLVLAPHPERLLVPLPDPLPEIEPAAEADT